MDNIKINCIPATILTRKLINKLLERNNDKNKKAGILNVASITGKKPHPYFHVYGATKAYIILFSECLKEEFPNLDVMVVNPSEVSSNMNYNRKPDMYNFKKFEFNYIS